MRIEASFRSEESFTQSGFRSWLDTLPPDATGRFELLRGRIVVSPPTRARHGLVEVSVATILNLHVRARGLGLVFGPSTGFELPSGDTLQPDASFVSNARWKAADRPGLDDFLRVVPDLVVEILSPSSIERDRREKREIYEMNGVAEYWIVDPAERRLEIHVPFDGGFGDPLVLDRGAIRSTVLPGIDASVEDLFS
ncbi:MAG: Uma2 family endonuclease [Alphaproteobacteria bacterium]